MALKHVLFGLLSLKASSGYSLHKIFFEHGRPMLPQIYRALNEMYAEGLVDYSRVEQKKLPARNVFRVTRAGRAELEKWVRGPSAVPPIREAIMLRVWFGSAVKKEALAANIKAYIEKKKEEIEYYDDTGRELAEKSLKKGYGGSLDRFHRNLAFDYIQRRGKAELEWAEDAIRQIANLNTEDVGMGGTGGKKRGRATKAK